MSETTGPGDNGDGRIITFHKTFETDTVVGPQEVHLERNQSHVIDPRKPLSDFQTEEHDALAIISLPSRLGSASAISYDCRYIFTRFPLDVADEDHGYGLVPYDVDNQAFGPPLLFGPAIERIIFSSKHLITRVANPALGEPVINVLPAVHPSLRSFMEQASASPFISAKEHFRIDLSPDKVRFISRSEPGIRVLSRA